MRKDVYKSVTRRSSMFGKGLEKDIGISHCVGVRWFQKSATCLMLSGTKKSNGRYHGFL